MLFNQNSQAVHECLLDYRFKKADIGRISYMIEWAGDTARNDYSCPLLTATCIFMKGVETTRRGVDVEKKYGMFGSHLSEVFWEVVKLFLEKFEYLLELLGGLLRQRASLYSQFIRDNIEPLPHCVASYIVPTLRSIARQRRCVPMCVLFWNST